MNEPPQPPSDGQPGHGSDSPDGPSSPYSSPPPSGPPSPYGRQNPPPQQGWDPQQGPMPSQPQQGWDPQQGWGPPQGPGPEQGWGPQPGWGPPQPPPTTGVDFVALLGARALRRPEARVGSALAAAGAGMALVGAFVWTIGYLVAGFRISFADDSFTPSVHGGSRHFLGLAVFVVLAVAGYAAVILRRSGPLATAGTVLGAASVPTALLFAFLDIEATFSGGDPINVDAVALLSILVWLASYFVVPGARGRAVYLALAAITLPSYIALKASGVSGVARAIGSSGSGSSTHSGTVAILGIAFGVVYYVLAALLDRAGKPGVAIGLLYPALTVTLSGLFAGADDLGQAGTGVALIVIGSLVVVYAGRAGRRFTAWTWAVLAAGGVVLIVAKIGFDHYAVIGIVLIVVGVVVVAGAAVASRALGEQPDIEEATPAAR